VNVSYGSNFYIDFIAKLYYTSRILAHEGRFLETILKAEQGMAFRGCGS
jgi:hypothetical protein